MSDSQSTETFSVLASKIRGIPAAMMTTIGEDSQLHSRPMVALQSTSGDSLWFFTSTESPVAQNIMHRASVNLSYVDHAAQRFVSVVGNARLTRDTDRMLEFWTTAVATWFPKGINDPELTLIHVDVVEADYWDGSAGGFVRLSGFIRSLLGDHPPRPDVNRGHIDMHNT